jgi:hypothetical protein
MVPHGATSPNTTIFKTNALPSGNEVSESVELYLCCLARLHYLVLTHTTISLPLPLPVVNTNVAAGSKTLQLMIYGEHKSVPLRGGGHQPHPSNP